MLIYNDIIYRGAPSWRIFSNEKRFVVFNGEMLTQVCVPQDGAFTVTEGDVIPIEPSDADKAEAYDILMGVSE